MTNIKISDIPINTNSSDLSDSSESYDDSFSEPKNETKDNSFPIKNTKIIEEKELNNIEIIIHNLENVEDNGNIKETIKSFNDCQIKKDNLNIKDLNFDSNYKTLKKSQNKKNAFKTNEKEKIFLRKKRSNK